MRVSVSPRLVTTAGARRRRSQTQPPRSSRALLLASGAIALALLAAACAPAAPPAAPTTAPAAKQAAPTAAPAAQSAPAASPAAVPTTKPAASAKPVTLTFWHGMNGTTPGTQGGTLQQLVNEYKKVAPNVTIKLDFTPYTGGELQQKITASIAANNTPDIVQAFESDVAAWYKAGAIVPLDDYIKKTLTADDLKDIEASLLDSGKFPQYDNKQLSFPFNKSIYVLYYNKPELTKVGYPDGPKTWDDLQKACEKIVADNMQCYAIQPSADSLIEQIWNRGGEVISKDLKTATFDNPEGVEALTFDQNNIKAKRAYVSKGFDWQNDFGAKKVAISPITTIAGDPFIMKAVNGAFEIGMSPVPVAPGKQQRALFSGTNLAIMKSTPEKEQAAWDFIKWLTETKQTAYWTTQTNYLPVRKSALNDPALQKYIAEKPRFKVALDLVKYGATGPSVAGWSDARTAMQEAVQAVDSLTKSPKDALSEAAKKATAALQRG